MNGEVVGIYDINEATDIFLIPWWWGSCNTMVAMFNYYLQPNLHIRVSYVVAL